MPGSGSGGVIRRGHGDHAMAYGKGTPMHYMNVSGIPPPGIGTHDLCIFCHGNGVSECVCSSFSYYFVLFSSLLVQYRGSMKKLN